MGSSDPYRATPAMGMGWEINTGMIAVRKSSRGLLEKWVQLFREEHQLFSDFESGEQQGVQLKRNKYKEENKKISKGKISMKYHHPECLTCCLGA